jgi:PAS domain S-box-containing protein
MTQSANSLRREAEKKIAISETVAAESVKTLTLNETHEMIHELKVHQIELEMQNEELRASQEELEESNNRYFDLYDLAPIGYVTIGKNGLIIQANLTSATLLNLGRGALVGKSIRNFIIKDDQDAYYLFINKLIRTEQSQVCELRIKRNNDGEIWVRLEAAFSDTDLQSSEKEDSEECVYRIILSDITERKEAEEALRKSEELLSKTSKLSGIGGWTLNFDTGISTWTEETSDIFEVNYDREALSLAEGVEFYTGKSKQILSEAIDLAKRTGTSYDLQLEITTINNNHRWVHTTGEASRENGKIVSISGTIQDITEKKNADEEKEKMNVELNNIHKLESIGLLAGGIAHDFNNLLGGMFGFVELAQMNIREGDLDLASLSLESAFKIFNRTRGLTQQLLTFSKGGAPTLKTHNIESLISSNIPHALADSKSTIKCNIDMDLSPCDCDEKQIGQVINIVTCNAQEAMPDGGNVTITARNISIETDGSYAGFETGNYIKISVIDEGVGIAKDLLHKIYDPFYTTKTVGRGLGLATVYSIIKQHNGRIEVKSDLDKGSTFDIYLPVSSAKESIAISKNESVSDRTETEKSLGRVLIMDDEEFMREIECAILKRMGYEVITSKDGEEAIALFTEAHASGNDFDFIILDLTVPGGLGGTETVKAIKQLDERAIVFVASGYADDLVMQNPTSYGFTDKISKPFRNATFVEMLDRHIKIAK